MARRPPRKSSESRLTAVERGVKSTQATATVIMNEMRDGFARVETRLDQIYNHIDGFVKLHETLDIEFRVIRSR
jgi:hypothetical protein